MKICNKVKWLVPLLLAALTLLFAACEKNEPAETTVSTTAATTAASTTSAVTLPPDVSESDEPVHSTSLYVTDSCAVFISPASGMPTYYDRKDGSLRTITYEPAWEEFFVAGERIFFRSLKSGRVCSATLSGTEYTEYYSMPFFTGMMQSGSMYFIDDQNYTDETVLYTYTPEEGTWSTAILSGNKSSPVRTTSVFCGGSVYYIADTDGEECVIEQELGTGERRIIYTVPSGNRLLELKTDGEDVYFFDASSSALYRSTANGCEQLELHGDRLFGVMNEGLLFGNSASYSGDMMLGNVSGQTVECRGGVVLACGLTRALIFRTDSSGRDCVAVVKYPEDTEQKVVYGTVRKTLDSRNGFAMVVIDTACYFVDINHARLTETDIVVAPRGEVAVPEYTAANDADTLPSAESVSASTPAELAAAFGAASARSDLEALRIIAGGAYRVDPFYALTLKSCRMSKSEDISGDTVNYIAEYVAYSEKDMLYSAFWPQMLTGRTLAFQRGTEGIWHIISQ